MIIDEFSTKDELDRLLYSIDKFKLDLYTYSTAELERCLHYQYDIKFNAFIQKVLEKNNLQLADDNKVKLEKLLADVAKEVASIEILELTIAFSPTVRFLNVLRHWIVENVSKNTVIAIHVDKSVLGGAAIVYRGHYLDLTISNKLKSFDFAL